MIIIIKSRSNGQPQRTATPAFPCPDPCMGWPALGSACLSHSPAAAGPWRWAEQRGGEPSTMKVGAAPGWARCVPMLADTQTHAQPLCALQRRVKKQFKLQQDRKWHLINHGCKLVLSGNPDVQPSWKRGFVFVSAPHRAGQVTRWCVTQGN